MADPTVCIVTLREVHGTFIHMDRQVPPPPDGYDLCPWALLHVAPRDAAQWWYGGYPAANDPSEGNGVEVICYAWIPGPSGDPEAIRGEIYAPPS